MTIYSSPALSWKYIIFLLLFPLPSLASYLLIPMDNTQKNHLKAYGIAYWTLEQQIEVDWLLNYRGGSFMIKYLKNIEDECLIRSVSYEIIPECQINGYIA